MGNQERVIYSMSVEDMARYFEQQPETTIKIGRDVLDEIITSPAVEMPLSDDEQKALAKLRKKLGIRVCEVCGEDRFPDECDSCEGNSAY